MTAGDTSLKIIDPEVVTVEIFICSDQIVFTFQINRIA
jgi:hypothetical protein